MVQENIFFVVTVMILLMSPSRRTRQLALPLALLKKRRQKHVSTSATISKQKLGRMRELKDFLVVQIEGTSVWRGGKAGEYPEDTRNERASAELAALAKHVKALPANHRLFQVIFEAVEDDDADGACLVEEENDLIRRYGFHGPGDVDSFVEELISIYEVALK